MEKTIYKVNTAIMTMSKFYFAAVMSILNQHIVFSSDIWYSVYDGIGCSTSNVVVESTAAADSCVQIEVQGTKVSTQIQCTSYSSESSWSANIYSESDCVGAIVSQLTASSACSCSNAELYGYSYSILVNCEGSPPSCSDFPIYVAAYVDDNCDTHARLTGSQTTNGDCAAYGAGDTAISSKIICDSNDETSKWTAYVYGNGECYGSTITETGGNDWKECGDITAFGAAFSFHVNCEGSEKKLYTDGGSTDGSDSKIEFDVVVIVFGVLGAIVLLAVLFVFIRKDSSPRKAIPRAPWEQRNVVTAQVSESCPTSPAANPMVNEL